MNPRPINTAPRDGTLVRAFDARYGWLAARCFNGCWPLRVTTIAGETRQVFLDPTVWTSIEEKDNERVFVRP